ncbi:M56 family metallopeptidase [Algoriphagus halophytocola]|uniref:M56 family metallopeptidase n=1 Tax=Algoriphagus halophytocola TaxID=2991499 RepID=A0ABY6MIP8_9BACT|nr:MULTISPECIES: M56 family metallopeptidase [unclassified Algoriphagus]UZD23667.1 M56 family metallopeptidase [Algoriphagus sp. TR-M5]WBL44960.1 M56 family metallopeptidase [Algoriphagus sp. TR-M9]
MDKLIIYLIESSICVGISVAFYKLVLSDLTFFALNRAILLLLLLMSFLFPAMSVNLGVANLGIQEFTMPEFLVGQGAAAERTFTWQSIVLMIYVAGVLVMTAHLILGFFTSQRLLGKSKLMLFQNHWIAVHPKFIPASFFQYILLPDFDPGREEQRQIILHESVHVRLKHSWDLLLIQFAKVIFWFNPLIYQFEKSLREVHEFQADQGVTSRYSKKEYSGLLLQMITKGQGWHFMNNFNQFQTKKRIIMMSKPESRSAEKRRFLLAIPLMAALFFVFSCEMTPEEEIDGPAQVAEKTNGIGPSNIAARVADVGKDGKEVFDITEVQPLPPGGMEGWNNYLASNLKYPEQAKKMGVEGTVVAVFMVNSDGSISDVDILRGIGAGADEEAMRVIRESQDWSPATQRGKAVNSRIRVPIRFKLD